MSGIENLSKRPIPVWIILIWYSLSCISSLVVFALMATGSIDLTPEQLDQINHAGAFGKIVSIITVIVNFVAAALLFTRKKIAVYAWVLVIILGILNFAYSYDSTIASNATIKYYLGPLIHTFIHTAICIYSWHLTKKNYYKYTKSMQPTASPLVD